MIRSPDLTKSSSSKSQVKTRQHSCAEEADDQHPNHDKDCARGLWASTRTDDEWSDARRMGPPMRTRVVSFSERDEVCQGTIKKLTPSGGGGGQKKALWVFDLDGTLLVSYGREIIEVDGMRAGIHPLIEGHVNKGSCSLLSAGSSDFRYCGEEDAHGDPHGLMETALVIEPVARVLRRALDEGEDVAILSARAHDPEWLAEQLEKKLGLSKRIRPEYIQCVYSPQFEEQVHAGSTADRKAKALEVLVERSGARAVHFFDDVRANLDGASRFFARCDDVDLHPWLVDFHLSLDALTQAGVDHRDLFHPQLRTERDAEPNDLVNAISRQLSYSSLVELQRLADTKPPPSPASSGTHVTAGPPRLVPASAYCLPP